MKIDFIIQLIIISIVLLSGVQMLNINMNWQYVLMWGTVYSNNNSNWF